MTVPESNLTAAEFFPEAEKLLKIVIDSANMPL
jgi:hypothetical protein